ncbi:hypothetical protein Tco_0692647 [Tanacetum coccineum]
MSQSRQLQTANQLILVNHQYELASANKKIDLGNPPCPPGNKEEVTFWLDELQTVLKLPQATANNNAELVEPSESSVMIEFLDIIGHIVWLRLAGQFYAKKLTQPWQTLGKILMRYLTTRIIGTNQPPLHIIELINYIIMLLMRKLYNLSSTSRRKGKSHSNDSITTDWVFQGTNRIISTPRSPNPQEQQSGESSTPKKPIIIRIPKRKQPDPKTPIPTVDQIDLVNLTEAQVRSYNIAKSVEENEAQQNIKRVEAHMLDEDVNRLVEGEEFDANLFADDMMLTQEDPSTRIDSGRHKESLEVEKVDEYVYVDEEEDEETTKAELIQRKGKGSLEIRDTPIVTPTRSPRNESLSLDKDKLKELMALKPSSSMSKHKSDRSRHFQGAIACSRNLLLMLNHAKLTLFSDKIMKIIMTMMLVLRGRVMQKMQRKFEKGMFAVGESSSKTTEWSYQTELYTQKHQKEYDIWSEDQGVDDDEVPYEEVTLKFLAKPWILTFDD